MTAKIIKLREVDGVVYASSRDLASDYHKRHDHVLRAVEAARSEISPDLGRCWFRDDTFYDSHNRPQPCIDMTRDGWTLVVMGFTGRDAMAFKVATILKFNEMEGKLGAGANTERLFDRSKQPDNVVAFQGPPLPQGDLFPQRPTKPDAPAIVDSAPDFPYCYHRDYADENVRSDNPPSHTQAEWNDLPVAARQEWREKYATPAQLSNYDLDDEIGDSETNARSIWARNRQDVVPFDYWTDGQSHIRLRNDLSEVWITNGDASIPDNKKEWLITSPNGKTQVLFYLNPPPPIDVVLRTYDRLGHGPYAAVGKATLRHLLSS